jgi:hypothetical protein
VHCCRPAQAKPQPAQISDKQGRQAAASADNDNQGDSMSATSVKNDPACGSVDQTVFVGNIGLVPFPEGEDPRYAAHKATDELAIDILAPEGYEKVEFEDITLTL